VSAVELRSTLETLLQHRIKDVRQRPSPYSSSFTIEELELTYATGETTAVVFKNLSSNAMLEGARHAKPHFLYTPEREIDVYRSVLPALHLGTAKMYGAVVEPALERYWLFIERVPGFHLYEIGEFETWLAAARWAAKLHSSCDCSVARRTVPHLLKYDESYYWRWIQRAHASAGSILDRIAARYDRVIEIFLEIPTAMLHGEFYASNILVHEHRNQVRVCPVDWEMAGIGPSLFDIAALASGKWSRRERLDLLEEYHATLPPRLRSDNYVTAFDCCQLHIALQWLGWSQSWSPPQPHAHDWLAEALQISSQESLAGLFG
jgi:hypothetical protein